MRRIWTRAGLAALGAGALALGAPPLASAASPLTLGFSSDPTLTAGTSSTIPWIAKAKADGAKIVRVNVLWSQVAPQQISPGFVATNPASPQYNWSTVDSAVRDLSSQGLQVMITILSAPRWAEQSAPPKGYTAGSWKPDPQKFGQFATAAATRYNGTFPDPSHPGSFLPRIRVWQAWNEPNLDYYLSPQWVKSGGHWTIYSTGLYRQLLNSFYNAVKKVSHSNFVVMGGTAPYGDPVGNDPLVQQRTQPMAFYRSLFCLQARTLKPSKCPGPSELDALDHHPYGVGGPTWHALNADDVAVPDVYKINRAVQAAVKAGHVTPGGTKRVWITEMGWSSKPPNSRGVPVMKDAHWYEQAFYVLWKQHVRMIMPIEIRDPSKATEFVFESGLYYFDGKPKPILTAYQFPFITQRTNKHEVLAWGRAPLAGKLKIQVKSGKHWKVLKSFSVSKSEVFSSPIGFTGSGLFRATIGSHTSLTWNQSA